MRVWLNGKLLEVVESFKYLGSISKDARVRMDVRQRVSEGAFKSIWIVKEVGMRAKKGLVVQDHCYAYYAAWRGVLGDESW